MKIEKGLLLGIGFFVKVELADFRHIFFNHGDVVEALPNASYWVDYLVKNLDIVHEQLVLNHNFLANNLIF